MRITDFRKAPRRGFLKAVLGLGLAPLAASAAGMDRPAQRRGILLQHSPVAGFQYHDGENIWRRLRAGDNLALVREPGNRYDSRAIAVYWKQHKLGYVPRRENATLAQMLDRGQQLHARISRLVETESPWTRVTMEIRLPPEQA